MKKIVVTILAALMLCGCALCVYGEWDEPFKDVKVGAWYYDAVKVTVEKGIFSGVAEDRFDPNGKMTRAMFVTTLAKVVGAQVDEYTGTPFTDVIAKAWYAPYVQWAYENDITNGISADKFGVDKPISREQMVTLFYNTAAKFGEDVSVTDLYKYAKVSDKVKVESWAAEAMKWAMQHSIISGTGTKGTMIVISPDATATRAQAAQIITKYLEFLDRELPPVTGLSFNGRPIEDFTIVYSDGNSDMKKLSNKLKNYILDATGITLEVTTDATGPQGPEMLVGKTNRESMGITVDRDGEDICSFEISVQDTSVVIAGKDDNYDGTEYGVYWFAKEILGIGFFTDDLREYTVIRDKDIPDGYILKENPLYEYRQIYWSGVPDELGSGAPFHGTGYVHNIEDYTEGLGRSTGADPCLTDPDIIAKATENVLKTLKNKPDLDTMWISMNDTVDGCMCEECMRINREEGSRFGTWARFLNIIAKEAEAVNPDVDFWTLAYHYTTMPPKTVLDENIVVYYCTINNCASHTYNDPTCPLNRSIYNHMVGWSKVCSKMYVWDYSTCFTYNLTAFPINTVLRENKSWFYDLGVRGEFNNAVTSKTGEFGPLKAYLIGELQWDPKMSDEEYNTKTDNFLKAYYGAGWKYIREYIDLTEELSDKNHFSYYTVPTSVLLDEQIIEYKDRFDALWDSAEALAADAEEQNRIRQSRLSWRFMKLNGTYNSEYVNGDAASRAAYMQANTQLYNDTTTFGVRWTEKGITVSFDATMPPYEWVS